MIIVREWVSGYYSIDESSFTSKKDYIEEYFPSPQTKRYQHKNEDKKIFRWKFIFYEHMDDKNIL